MSELDLLQQNVVECSRTSFNNILSWGTGVGKSLTAIKIQEDMGSKKTYICVAEITHIDNWRQEYIKYGKEELLKTTTIFCYDSLSKYSDTEIDLLINDECHHISDLRADYLSTITPKKVINLSATLKPDELQRIALLWGKPYVSMVGLNCAIDLKILTQPTFYIKVLKLNNTVNTEVIEIAPSKPISHEPVVCTYLQRKAVLSNPINKKKIVRIECTQQQKYDYYTERINEFKRNYFLMGQDFRKFRWLAEASARKRYISSLKTRHIRDIISKLEGKKLICFCGSIAQAELLNKNQAIHSAMKAKDINDVLEKFKTDEISSLFVVDKLKEAVNLPGIELAILSQLDGHVRSFIQKSGRAMRNKINPEIYIIYIKDTQDEKYFNNAFTGINPEFIKYI